MDRVISEHVGSMSYYWALSRDGGESIAAATGRDSPWHSKRDLQEYLDERQRLGTHQDYEIVKVDDFPQYHRWSRDAMRLLSMFPPAHTVIKTSQHVYTAGKIFDSGIVNGGSDFETIEKAVTFHAHSLIEDGVTLAAPETDTLYFYSEGGLHHVDERGEDE
jgi:hypothetical protein